MSAREITDPFKSIITKLRTLQLSNPVSDKEKAQNIYIKILIEELETIYNNSDNSNKCKWLSIKEFLEKKKDDIIKKCQCGQDIDKEKLLEECMGLAIRQVLAPPQYFSDNDSDSSDDEYFEQKISKDQHYWDFAERPSSNEDDEYYSYLHRMYFSSQTDSDMIQTIIQNLDISPASPPVASSTSEQSKNQYKSAISSSIYDSVSLDEDPVNSTAENNPTLAKSHHEKYCGVIICKSQNLI